MNTHTDPMPAILKEMDRSNAKGRITNSADMPAVSALIDAAISEMTASIPHRFEHGGKTFYLRVSIGMARLEIFETPDSDAPLCHAMYGSFDTHGHPSKG